MTEQQPIGRNVHYVAYGTPGGEFPAGAHRAAIITEVHQDGVVGLAVLIRPACSSIVMCPMTRRDRPPARGIGSSSYHPDRSNGRRCL